MKMYNSSIATILVIKLYLLGFHHELLRNYRL